MQSSALQPLISLIQAKDQYTGGHVLRVAQFALLIARRMEELSEADIEALAAAAALHDLGKVAIDERILNKPSQLDADEWRAMREHPELGQEILARFDTPQGGDRSREIALGIRHHHERWDGAGYPQGLRGESIPWISRVIAVADAFDAMISTRCYRKALSVSEACDEILEKSGTQFDPRVVRAFFAGVMPDRVTPEASPSLP
jgi:HD-GYP domain-containing protein (c-di-GMP phosphodiesterase class II)